jgi:hypothetical protein
MFINWLTGCRMYEFFYSLNTQTFFEDCAYNYVVEIEHSMNFLRQ